MPYTVVYDGKCNLCTTLVRLLEKLDRGQQFQYLPMQDEVGLARYGIRPADCEQGMMVIDQAAPDRRWQGSAAVEEIGRLLPGGYLLVQAYRALPGLKWTGDRLYEQVRDHRYELFGERSELYHSELATEFVTELAATDCTDDACAAYFDAAAPPESAPAIANS